MNPKARIAWRLTEAIGWYRIRHEGWEAAEQSHERWDRVCTALVRWGRIA